jgi:transposase-like protein
MTDALNISQLAKYFSDEDAARELLEEMRWDKDGAVCPHCGGERPYTITGKATSKKPARKGLYKCRACRKQFTVTVKTVFEDSHIPISKWLLAIHLLASSKKGISAHQLHRNLGISYKGAWFMAHRLRWAMSNGGVMEMLGGTVEIDETYVGGRKRGKRGRPGRDSNKTPVVALVERGSGRVVAKPMHRVTADNLGKMLDRHVRHDATMMTDDFVTYKAIAEDSGRKHLSVNHSADEWVNKDDKTIHSNTVEGFFSLLKRGINGTFHHVSREHLGRYCDEFAFRYERRKMSDGARAAQVVLGAEGKRLTYKQPA